MVPAGLPRDGHRAAAGPEEHPPALQLALAMVVSLVLVSLVATTLTVAGILSEASAFLALAAICLAGCALQVAEESWGSVSPKKS